MKENLKIETPNKRDNAEATKLFRELGYPNLFADEMFVYATSSIANTIRTISPEELLYFDKPEMMIDAVLDMPPSHRVKTVTIHRDLALEELIKTKVSLAQSYARELIKQLN